MAKNDQPRTDTQRKPENPIETKKKDSPELTDDELSKARGGVMPPVHRGT